MQPGILVLFCLVLTSSRGVALAEEANTSLVDNEEEMIMGHASTIVVTGTRTGHLLFDAPIRTELIRHEDIVRSGARNLY